MKPVDVDFVSVEVVPSRVIEVDCEIRAIPAGDLAAIDGIRKAAEAAADSSQESSLNSAASAQSAETSKKQARTSQLEAAADAARALNSAIDADEDALLAKESSEYSAKVLAAVTDMHGEIEQAWVSIDRATLMAISADLIRTQALMVEFHGFK